MDNSEKLATLGTQDAGRRQTKQKNTSLYTNYVNKIWTLLQTTGGKDEPNIFSCGNRNNNKYTVYM